MSQQQHSSDVSIDEIPVDISNTQSAEIDPSEMPEEIWSLTRGLASTVPPTNPLVVHSREGWYGSSLPVAIEWARHLATDTPSDVERFDEFLECLVTVEFADEPHELR